MDIYEIAEYFIDAIKGKTYFRVRTIANDYFQKKTGNIINKIPKQSNEDKLRNRIIRQISFLTEALKKEGYIQKFNTKSWIRLRDITLTKKEIETLILNKNIFNI